jgi:hypothetical protein
VADTLFVIAFKVRITTTEIVTEVKSYHMGFHKALEARVILNIIYLEYPFLSDTSCKLLRLFCSLNLNL